MQAWSTPQRIARNILFVALLLALLGARPTLAQTENVVIYQAHLFLQPTGEQVWIVEHYLVGNDGDVANLAAPDGSDPMPASGLRFALPVGATHIAVGAADDLTAADERYRVTDGAVIFTEAIPINTEQPTEVRFSYLLPLRTGQTITRSFPLPVESAVLLLVGEDWQLSGSDIESFGTVEVNGQSARGYTVEPLVTGAPLRFTVEAVAAQPTQPVPAAGKKTALDTSLLLGLAALALAGGVAVWLWRPKKAPVLTPPKAVQETIAEIVALDAHYEEGHLEQSQYLETRSSLLARIRKQLEVPLDDRNQGT